GILIGPATQDTGAVVVSRPLPAWERGDRFRRAGRRGAAGVRRHRVGASPATALPSTLPTGYTRWLRRGGAAPRAGEPPSTVRGEVSAPPCTGKRGPASARRPGAGGRASRGRAGR